MALQRKSRLVRNELDQAKHDVRRYLILTVALSVFGFFLGLPIVTRFAAFVHELTSSDQPIEISDKTPPAPPLLHNVPTYTNKETLEINGSSEPGSIVKVFVNNTDNETVANNEGSFTAQIKIHDGDNRLWAKAVDEAGNESQETNKLTLIYDNEPPELQLSKPQDGDSFYSDKNREISVEGQTEGADKITVNDRVAIIDQNGKFNLNIRLDPGTNEIKIKASDAAGNESEMTISITYSE